MSDLVRKELDNDELWVIDGNPEKIKRIIIAYQRNTKIKPKNIPENAEFEFVKWDYTESIVIDRQTETVEIRRIIGEGCKISHKYYVQGGVEQLLDNLNCDFFDCVEDTEGEIFENPMETKDYVITVYTNHHELHEIKGRFDKEGLPVNYPIFVKDLFDFLFFYGMSESITPANFTKHVRHKGDLIFCQVIFEENGKEYCYLADEDTYAKGDLVVVPVGKDNKNNVALIREIIYAPENKAPFPIDKIKHIIKKYDKDSE